MTTHVHIDPKEVQTAALEQLHAEKFREAVETEKQRLRRPWWRRVFPWRVRVRIVFYKV